MLPFRVRLAVVFTSAFVVPAVVPAQQHEHGDGPAAAASRHGPAHLRITASRMASAADSVRAAEIERALLAYLTRFEDVRAAEAAGYVQFAPRVKSQRVFHYTRRRHALQNAFSFDAARPTSLLYRRAATGELELAGAMYTAPARATDAELDTRVPLGIATWHQHVNICVPRGSAARWQEQQGGSPRFGPAGAIATREECLAAEGRWLPRVFGWMVHANLERTAQGTRISWEHSH